MIDVVIKLLQKNNIKDYLIQDETRESVELFFVKRKTDLVRSKKVREIKLSVYRDFEDFRGTSVAYIYPEMDEIMMEKEILSAYESAKHIKNPYFELPMGTKIQIENDITDLKTYAVNMAKALYLAEDEVKGAFINSSEFFAKKNLIRIVNSAGCDVSYVKTGIEGEFVVQCVTDKEDVELYQDFKYEDMDTQALKNKALDTLNMVKDRAVATKAPADLSEYPIVITDAYVGELLKFYLNRCNASYIYPGYSDYHKGYKIPECINIKGIPDKPFSDEGIPMVDKDIIKDGVVENIHGSVAFLSYVKSDQVGEYKRIECSNGDEKLDEMLTGKYIMVKNFSDFQVDTYDGHFGGEFRLAYLCDEGKITILTGGTVSGNIMEESNKLVFSKERYKDAYYEGPAAVKIESCNMNLIKV